MNLTMPTMLSWVLGGNIGALRESSRAPMCRLSDAPKAFKEAVRPWEMSGPSGLKLYLF